MSAVLTPVPGPQLPALYGRYKALTLAAGARLLLGAPDPDLEAQAQLLADDARALAVDRPDLAQQLQACDAAARALQRLATADGTPQAAARLDEVRATHRRLRDAMWLVTDCEYAPCGTHHAHAHPKEPLHG
jgi:hypothetical protein